MTDAPNPDDFSFVDKPTEFRVRLEVMGEISLTITADNIEAARASAQAQADKMIDGEDWAELDEVEQVDVGHVYQSPRMYRVTSEDGRKMQVSRLEVGMKPREPDERGF